MLNLITDRTMADVQRWRQLHDKGWRDMSAAEKTEWMSEMKGRYAASDMNRVEAAVEALSAELTANGYYHSPLETKTDWNATDIPTVQDMMRYLQNIRTLRNAISVPENTPPVPSIGQNLDYKLANDVEKILLGIEFAIAHIQSLFYCGDLYGGEI